MGYERQDPRRWRGHDTDYRSEQRYRSGRGYRDASSDYDQDDRGFFDRAGDEVRSWFGDEEAERRRRMDEREYERERQQRSDYDRSGAYGPSRYAAGSGGGYGGAGRNFGGIYGGPDYAGYGTGGPTRYAPYTGGTYRESSSDRYDPYDPHYREWRNREIEALDRDYFNYRRENQSRFEQDFGSWRNTRQTQRQSLRSVQEHQEVVGSDGNHVGTVDHVRDDRIILTKTDQDAGGHHHSVPCAWISRVSDKVELNRSANEAQQAWKDEERRSAIGGRAEDADGPHVLNRSFAGTY